MIICKPYKNPNPTGEILLLLGREGSELKLGKTPLFQISGECRRFSPDWTIQIELQNILWGSHSQISFFTLRNFLILSLSRRVHYNDFTFIVASILFPVRLFETFLFCLSFYQKSPICHQSHWRLLSPVLTCPLMANKCNNTFFPKPHQTFYGQMLEMNLMKMPVTSWWHISVRIWNLFPKTAL